MCQGAGPWVFFEHLGVRSRVWPCEGAAAVKEMLGKHNRGARGHRAEDTAQLKSKAALPRVAPSHARLSSSIFSSPSQAHPTRSFPLSPSVGGEAGRGSRLRCHLLMDGGGQSPGARRAPQNLELSPADHTLGVGTLWGLSASLAPPRPLSLTVRV